jgi:Flp pilus assembly pilin Flp
MSIVLRRRDGQVVVEYAVLLGLVTLAVVGAITALTGGITGVASAVTTAI